MGLYKFLSNRWREENMPAELKRARLIEWRRQPVTLRVEKPTRLDKARALGYRAKPGIFVVRQRVDRGSHRREDWSGGRHSHNMGARLMLRKNYRVIAEQRAERRYQNCEVLNSYYVAEDGKNYWYEIILADRFAAGITAKGRSQRGLTSAGRRHRGLLHKGKGSEKTRPSRRVR